VRWQPSQKGARRLGQQPPRTKASASGPRRREKAASAGPTASEPLASRQLYATRRGKKTTTKTDTKKTKHKKKKEKRKKRELTGVRERFLTGGAFKENGRIETGERLKYQSSRRVRAGGLLLEGR
jgi:hypothetical protein